MTIDQAVEIVRDMLITALIISSPILIAGLAIGLVISIFQAVTQIHEMTLTFIPKIVAVALGLLFFLPWIINKLVDFTTRLFESIPSLIS